MFVIPMAGGSTRFFSLGYEKPKYELELWGSPMLDWVLCSFQRYFKSDLFHFVVREDFGTKAFVADRCRFLGLEHVSFTELNGTTSGQGETVLLGLNDIGVEEELFIFNADSFHRDFVKEKIFGSHQGVIDVFRGEGDHWSFVEPGLDAKVVRTAEKTRISDLCSSGLYYFSDSELFARAYKLGAEAVLGQSKETYIAPLYNYLVNEGADIVYREVPRDVLYFCGTPAEYQSLQSQANPFEGLIS